jgi:hypothetical protein
MKKVYNIPSTTTVAFRSAFICDTASPAAGMGIGGGTLGGGGEAITPVDPL